MQRYLIKVCEIKDETYIGLAALAIIFGRSGTLVISSEVEKPKRAVGLYALHGSLLQSLTQSYCL